MRSTRSASRRLLPALVLPCLLGSCMTHVHTVGLGPTGAKAESQRQYYWLYGLVDFNEVDSQRMAGDLTSYSVETRFDWGDVLLFPFLLPLLATSRNVIVRT